MSGARETIENGGPGVVEPSLRDVRAALALDAGYDERARDRMGARPRPVRPSRPWREGAVLVLLYPVDGGLSLVLTRRTETVEHHRGQISLPGGAREEGESPVETALREAREEVGIRAEEVEVLGRLADLRIPPSGFIVHPFVGHASARPDFRPDPREVAEVIEVRLSVLLDPARRKEEERSIRGMKVIAPYFDIDGVGAPPLWGATAMMLAGLVERLRAVRSR